jgi:hypothetical protein
MKNSFEEYLVDTPDEEVKLDVEKIKSNIQTYGSEKLCEMIVCDRYFGFNQEITVICMEELSRRRSTGDVFDFESYIKNSESKLPVLDFKLPDFKQLIGQIKR